MDSPGHVNLVLEEDVVEGSLQVLLVLNVSLVVGPIHLPTHTHPLLHSSMHAVIHARMHARGSCIQVGVAKRSWQGVHDTHLLQIQYANQSSDSGLLCKSTLLNSTETPIQIPVFCD